MKFLFDHDVPDELAFALMALGHEVSKLRELLPMTALDEEVLGLAGKQGFLMVTCNRNDFLALAERFAHEGIIVLVRRRSRALERAAMIRLVEAAGEEGLRGNINFA